jgi:preprotein translocase subunit SecG
LTVYNGRNLRIFAASMSILINLLLGFNMLVALLMILVILMQRPKSEGLGAAFGGGVTENIFGAQTTNVLTKITGWLAGIFFVLTFALSILYAERSVGGSSLRRELMRTQAAAEGAQSGSPAAGTPSTAAQSPNPAAKITSAAPSASPKPVGAVVQPSMTAAPSPAQSTPTPQSP